MAAIKPDLFIPLPSQILPLCFSIQRLVVDTLSVFSRVAEITRMWCNGDSTGKDVWHWTLRVSFSYMKYSIIIHLYIKIIMLIDIILWGFDSITAAFTINLRYHLTVLYNKEQRKLLHTWTCTRCIRGNINWQRNMKKLLHTVLHRLLYLLIHNVSVSLIFTFISNVQYHWWIVLGKNKVSGSLLQKFYSLSVLIFTNLNHLHLVNIFNTHTLHFIWGITKK